MPPTTRPEARRTHLALTPHQTKGRFLPASGPNYYALLPLLVILAIINPAALEALSTALGIVLSLQRLH